MLWCESDDEPLHIGDPAEELDNGTEEEKEEEQEEEEED